ncbi:hypothetical protein PRVXH_001740 [Proteinivorax hydrogeniformans]|uniref:Uncharacterized protein n=1 Tax=Proteinivorax hydrogeniformans TaxID=1826727 RepID=A0AAU8HRQ0_9FIRM
MVYLGIIALGLLHILDISRIQNRTRKSTVIYLTIGFFSLTIGLINYYDVFDKSPLEIGLEKFEYYTNLLLK